MDLVCNKNHVIILSLYRRSNKWFEHNFFFGFIMDFIFLIIIRTEVANANQVHAKEKRNSSNLFRPFDRFQLIYKQKKMLFMCFLLSQFNLNACQLINSTNIDVYLFYYIYDNCLWEFCIISMTVTVYISYVCILILLFMELFQECKSNNNK